jgi:hypothetical protein
MRNWIYLSLILLTACIEPYAVEVPEGESMLSVEGHITNGPGPHTIKITRTATYGSVFVDFIRPVTQAIVAIRENESGLVIFLNERIQGVYETPSFFSATIGRTYSLKITTREGVEYTSFPSLAQAVPQLDSLTYRTIIIPTENRLQPRSGLQLVAFYRDPSETRNFYYWRVKNAISAVQTFPERYRPPGSLPNSPYQPKPCCSFCDIPDSKLINALFLAEDSNFNGLNTGQIAGFIEDNGFRLSYKYRFDFEQLAISEDTYRFLRLINQQMTLSGSVFDPPPANIRGNIVCLTNPEETVLGHFFAAGVSETKINLSVEDLDLFQIQRPFNDDCRVLTQPVAPRPVDP